MYSNLKNVQILVAGLKAFGIRHVVVSPGNSHNAIVRSVEEDDFFTTHSVVDERSAAFFACGICQELNEPVAICCTAGTAASNYLTGVTEAARRALPIVVITGDKNPYFLGQGEDQMIDAPAVFTGVVRESVKLPICETSKDEWYCSLMVNTALLELEHHGTGPVQIDVPIEEGMLAIGGSFGAPELPAFSKVERLDPGVEDWGAVFRGLSGKRVLIMYGQDRRNPEAEALLDEIARKFDIAVSVDKLSNIHADCCVESQIAFYAGSSAAGLLPDVIISLAGNPATQFKFLPKWRGIESWLVAPDGVVRDYYKSLRLVFECDHLEFLRRMVVADVPPMNAGHYLAEWRRFLDALPAYPQFGWSNLYSTSCLMEAIPAGSILNLANSTTIRIAQYFDLDPSVEVFCNRGVNGIDGCMSTFIGQSCVHDGLSFLIIGDLTFFYDMNALWNRYVGKNVRIMLVNNGGAALFHFNQGLRSYPGLDENVAARHSVEAGGWVESLGIRYARVDSKESFEAALPAFVDPVADGPMLLECVTAASDDATAQHEFYNSFLSEKEKCVAGAKKIVKKIIGR